jgi:RNA polymerase sigma factor (sigma-70 family)
VKREPSRSPNSPASRPKAIRQTLENRFFDGSHPRWANCWSTAVGNWARTPEQQLLAGEAATRIQEAARRLPEAQRAVFLLRDVEGWCSEEICEALDISGANQRVLLHRARNALRTTLEEYLKGEEG